MSNLKEPTAEELLSRLIGGFFVSTNGGLEWGYQEGYTLRELFSLDLERQLSKYLQPLNMLSYQQENGFYE